MALTCCLDALSERKRSGRTERLLQPPPFPEVQIPYVQTFSNRYSRSQGLITCMNVSYSVRFTAE